GTHACPETPCIGAEDVRTTSTRGALTLEGGVVQPMKTLHLPLVVVLVLGTLLTANCHPAAAQEATQTGEQTAAARGPLRVHPDNPRYFTDGTELPDGSLRAVFLTGSHTWNNLVDIGRSDPPEAFDFEAYLDFLKRYGHNFIRLWAWDS